MTSINLKKAAAIVNELNKVVKENEIMVSGVANVSVFTEDLGSEISKIDAVIAKKIEKSESVINLMYDIRDKVNTANYEADIDKLLNKLASKQKMLDAFKYIDSNSSVMQSQDILTKLFEVSRKKLEDSSDSYGLSSEVRNIHPLTEQRKEEILNRKKKLDKEIKDLKEQLLELNISHKITLSDKQTKQLKGLDIL